VHELAGGAGGGTGVGVGAGAGVEPLEPLPELPSTVDDAPLVDDVPTNWVAMCWKFLEYDTSQ
jgi:hypothetical protein